MLNTQTVCLCFCLLISLAGTSQKADKQLERTLISMTEAFRGDVGFYVKSLKTGRVVSFRADSIFPTASIIKVPILIGIVDKLEKGELKYHDLLTYRDSLLYPGVDILGSFKDSQQIELSKVLMLMCTMSDNTASLWLQQVAGSGTRINALMEQLGLLHTRVNSRTPGREENRKQYGWGQTTPAEMATLFERMANRQLLNGHASDRIMRLLGRNYWDEDGLSPIPPGVFVASKNGAVDASRSEAMFVNGKKEPYIFCLFTKNNADKTWEASNEAWVLTRRMSQYLYKYFNGD
jgi:beta-lactamase class A